MLRRAWQLGVAARGGAASTSAVSPSSAAHAATPRARLAPWSAAPLSSRADGPDEEQARRRALRRAARRELRAWRGADVTPRELRELKDGGGSKRRWARDWASAVFADDVGDGASYEAFVAEALRHGDGRRGPGSGPASDTGADTRRARREKSVRRAGGSGAPKGGGTRGVKYKHRRGDAKSSRRRETSRRRRGARDDDFADDPVEWHEEHACDEADAFWRAFLRAARGTSRVGARKSANDRGDRGTDRREGFERSFRFEDFARARARFGNHPRRRRRRPVARRLRHVSRPLGAGDRAWRGTEQNAPEVVAARGGDEVAPGPPRRRRRQARRRGGVQKVLRRLRRARRENISVSFARKPA